VALFSTNALYTAHSADRTDYDVAADGRFLMVKQPPGTGENQAIVVVADWLDEVRQRLGQ